MAAATELTGRLDGLFACAGGSTGVGPLATSDVETIRSTMELNYIGTFLCIKHGGTQMARQEDGGSIIGCSSHAGSDPFRCLGAYGPRKPGLTTSAESPPTKWVSSGSGSTPSSPASSAPNS